MLFIPDDPEQRFGRAEGGGATPSIAFTRALAATEAALSFAKRDTVVDRQAVKETRAYVRKLQLSPAQMYDLITTTRTIAGDLGFEQRNADPNKPHPQRPCTYGQWRNAAWLVCRSATSLLAESYRPERLQDFLHFTELLSQMANYAPLTGRERGRILSRLKRNLVNVYYGLSPGYGMPQPRVKSAKSLPVARTSSHRDTAIHASL